MAASGDPRWGPIAEDGVDLIACVLARLQRVSIFGETEVVRLEMVVLNQAPAVRPPQYRARRSDRASG